METKAQHMYFRCLTILNNRAYLLPSYCSLIFAKSKTAGGSGMLSVCHGSMLLLSAMRFCFFCNMSGCMSELY